MAGMRRATFGIGAPYARNPSIGTRAPYGQRSTKADLLVVTDDHVCLVVVLTGGFSRVVQQQNFRPDCSPFDENRLVIQALDRVAADAAALGMAKEDLIEDFLIAYQESLTQIGFSSKEIARLAAAALVG